MVHVALAGGSGNVGREITEELVAQGKHQVTVLSRNGAPELTQAGINVVKVDYLNPAELKAALKGVHTVLSFVVADPENKVQKALIAACIDVGVKRFAPSEWAAISNSGIAPYKFKDDVHEYLKEINDKKTVLEYTLFQCGVFMNYLAYPHVTAKYLFITCVGYDIESGNAVLVEEGEEFRVFTTVQDTAKVVAAAVGYEGKWPEIGGIVGSKIRPKDVVKLLEKYSGRPMAVHKLKKADLAKGEYNSDWIPPLDHPNMPPAMKTPQFMRYVISSFELAAANGAANVTPDWNELLPDMKMTDVDTFLAEALGAKNGA